MYWKGAFSLLYSFAADVYLKSSLAQTLYSIDFGGQEEERGRTSGAGPSSCAHHLLGPVMLVVFARTQ